MTKALLVAANLAILAIYIIGSARWVSTGNDFYRSLELPAWQPPGAVFGIMWTYNYAMLAIVGTLVVLRATPAVWLGCFAASVIAALGWAYLFYIQQNPPLSAVALTLAALITIPMVVVAFRYSVWTGVAMVPYIVWLFLATSLAHGISVLNPRS